MKKSLKIFLSSTVKDLAPEREIAARAIERLKLEAIRMETFGSSSQTPLEICKQMVQDSDVFVGIYGGRYGYVPHNQTQSVTEIEFQEARRSGKDILVYIKASEEIEDIQAEFLRRVDDFEGGYFRRPPFRTLTELEEWLKEDLIALLSSRFVTTRMPKANTLVDEYRSYVSTLYRKVTFAGLAQTPSGLSLPIESVFVAPNLRELKPSGEAGAEIVDLDDALTRNHRAVIVGGPGSGKTMLLKHLACSTADKGTLLPVLVPLVSLVGDDSNGSFYDRLSDFIGSRTEQRFEGLVEDALSSSRALVMLDGLDEIEQPDKIASVLADLSAFSESYPKIRIILTTRPSGRRPITGFSDCEIQPWTEEQIFRFTRQWSAALNEDLELSTKSDVLSEKSDELFETIVRHRDLFELARNPLFLTLLAFLHRQGYRLPTRRVELYDAIAKTMMGSWDRARSLSHTFARRFRQPEVENFLSLVALAMTRSGKRTIEVSEIHSLAENIIAREEFEALNILFEGLASRTGIMSETAEGRFGFVHLAFQEFFAAKAVTYMDDDDFLKFVTSHFYKPQYEEVVRLALSWIDAHGGRQALVTRAAEALLNAAKN